MPDDRPAATALFSNHPRTWQSNRYVYPVISRRSQGLSIGVNLNPDKACNFDCVYCSVDRREPATIRIVDLDVVRVELDHLLRIAADGSLFAQAPFDSTPSHLRRINDVAFSGDGEPTTFPRFLDACRIAAELLDQHRLSDVKLVVITNATVLDRPAAREALTFLDHHRGEIWAKLDAGTESWYQTVERTKVPLATVLANLLAAGQTRELVIQSLFCRVHGTPPSAAEIIEYVERLRELRIGGCRIRLVQVYTTARTTAESYVAPLTSDELDGIAAAIRVIGLNAAVFP